jgi:hypothetical protein
MCDRSWPVSTVNPKPSAKEALAQNRSLAMARARPSGGQRGAPITRHIKVDVILPVCTPRAKPRERRAQHFHVAHFLSGGARFGRSVGAKVQDASISKAASSRRSALSEKSRLSIRPLKFPRNPTVSYPSKIKLTL